VKNTGCREQDLVSYYYGDLDTPARTHLETHLQGCPACRENLAGIHCLLDGLPREKVELAPADLGRFAARVAGRATARRSRRVPVWGGALAAAAVLGGILLVRWPGSAPEIRPAPAASEIGILSELELLQDLDLLENLEWLQELEGTG
jgi:anti-sigma factor RsiW